jgi:outer membrane protein OmpA-like peptidoglycan-associated protein
MASKTLYSRIKDRLLNNPWVVWPAIAALLIGALAGFHRDVASLLKPWSEGTKEKQSEELQAQRRTIEERLTPLFFRPVPVELQTGNQFGPYGLDSASSSRLQNQIALLRGATFRKLLVEAHTHAVEPPANFEMSQVWAEEVRERLIAGGIPKDKIELIPRGGLDSNPDLPPEYNRRVVIKIVW